MTIGILVPSGTSTPKRPKAAVKAKLIAVGEAMLRRVERGANLLEPAPCGRRPFLDERVFTIAVSLRVLFVDGDDLFLRRDEVLAVRPEAVDDVGETKAAVLDEG
jgi:hypothetical protein